MNATKLNLVNKTQLPSWYSNALGDAIHSNRIRGITRHSTSLFPWHTLGVRAIDDFAGSLSVDRCVAMIFQPRVLRRALDIDDGSSILKGAKPAPLIRCDDENAFASNVFRRRLNLERVHVRGSLAGPGREIFAFAPRFESHFDVIGHLTHLVDERGHWLPGEDGWSND